MIQLFRIILKYNEEAFGVLLIVHHLEVTETHLTFLKTVLPHRNCTPYHPAQEQKPHSQ